MEKHDIEYWVEWMRKPEHKGLSWIDVAGALLQETLYKTALESEKAEIRFLALGMVRK